MPQDVSRGHVPADRRDFSEGALPLLQYAQQDIRYLLDRGYDLEHAVTFVCNRFQHSARQRTALTRATAGTAALQGRRARCRRGELRGETVHIDGFNLVITLEAAQSPQTTLLRCMDRTVRDLCGLHGTYRPIASTATALQWIGEALTAKGVSYAHFFLDAPVSNSGRLRGAILAEMALRGLPCEVSLVPNADAELWDRELVVTSDAIILDRCHSWVNLAAEIIAARLPGRRVVDLGGADSCGGPADP